MTADLPRRASRRAPLRRRLPARAMLVLAVVPLLIWAFEAIGPGRVGAQGAPVVGLDLDTAGNTATSLGPIDTCTRVHVGDQFDVDVYVQAVPAIDGVQASVHYDATVLRPVGREVNLFLGVKPGSKVSALEKPTQGTGTYLVAGFDLGKDSAEAGSGAAVRITFEALSTGTSALEASDVVMIDDSGSPVEPADGIGRFTGTVTGGGVVAVDTTCDAQEPTPGASTTAAPTFQPSRVPSTATALPGSPAPAGSAAAGSTPGPSTPGTGTAAAQTASATGATAAPTFRSDARGASTTPGAVGQPAAQFAQSEDAGSGVSPLWWAVIGTGVVVLAGASALAWRRSRGARHG